MNPMNVLRHGGAIFGLAVGLTLGVATTGTAQSVTGQAYGAYANTPGGSLNQSALAVLPATSGTDGELAAAQASGVSTPGVLTSSFLTSNTTGVASTAESDAQSVATLGATNVLNGLIQASGVTAIASSTRTAAGAASNAAGSTLGDLVVAGVPVTLGDQAVAPNTNIPLPGVGYVVLNEQISTGDGVTTSGLTVNMIHVYLQGLMPGQIILGSASSAVGP